MVDFSIDLELFPRIKLNSLTNVVQIIASDLQLTPNVKNTGYTNLVHLLDSI